MQLPPAVLDVLAQPAFLLFFLHQLNKIDPGSVAGRIALESDEEEQNGFVERPARGHRHEDREAKRERKKAAKDEAREKRKHKMPKAEKKKKIKASRGGK